MIVTVKYFQTVSEIVLGLVIFLAFEAKGSLNTNNLDIKMSPKIKPTMENLRLHQQNPLWFNASISDSLKEEFEFNRANFDLETLNRVVTFMNKQLDPNIPYRQKKIGTMDLHPTLPPFELFLHNWNENITKKEKYSKTIKKNNQTNDPLTGNHTHSEYRALQEYIELMNMSAQIYESGIFDDFSKPSITNQTSNMSSYDVSFLDDSTLSEGNKSNDSIDNSGLQNLFFSNLSR